MPVYLDVNIYVITFNFAKYNTCVIFINTDITQCRIQNLTIYCKLLCLVFPLNIVSIMTFFNGIKYNCTVWRIVEYSHCIIFTWVQFKFVNNYFNENFQLYQFYVYAELNGFTTKICSNCRVL